MLKTRCIASALCGACAFSCVELTGVGARDAAADAQETRDAAMDVDGSRDAATDARDPSETGSRACLGPSRLAPGAIDGTRSRWATVSPWTSGVVTRAAAIDPQGRTMVFGYVYTPSAAEDAFVMRLLSNGEVDTTWGEAGFVRVESEGSGGPGRDGFHAGGFDATGRLVVAGWTFGQEVAPVYRGLAARFTSDGRLDPSFGRDGVVRASAADGGFGPYGSLLDGDELLLVGSEAGNRLGEQGYVVRLTSRGVLDPTFGVAGTVTIADTRVVRSAVRDGDGYIVAAVVAEPMGAALVRLQHDGSLDARFGEGGVAVHPRGQGVIPVSLLRQPDGALVIYGAYSPLANVLEGAPTLLRYDADGSSDLGYGDGGVVASREGQVEWAGVMPTTAAMQCDGSVLALSIFGRFSPMLQRFTVDGARDPDFGQGGRVIIPTLTAGGWPFAVLPRSGEASAVVISAANTPRALGHHVVGL